MLICRYPLKVCVCAVTVKYSGVCVWMCVFSEGFYGTEAVVWPLGVLKLRQSEQPAGR